MGQKTLQVHLRVSAEQRDYMRGKAASYGIPLSRLVLTAVEAYVRSYDDNLGDAQLVVVNYGVWSRVDRDLGSIESVLREAAQQLVGARWAVSSGVKSGALGHRDATVIFDTLKRCHEDVSHMREAIDRCTALMDRVCESAHLVDPYLGPMEGFVPEGDGAPRNAHGETDGE